MGDSWIMQISPARPDLPTLICLPHAGGGASAYRKWTALPEDLNVVAVQPPGRENRKTEPCLRQMPTLLDGIEEAIAGLTRLPYVLLGHSIGALTAYEVARRQRLNGGPPPVCLLVSAFPPPHTLSPQPLHELPDQALLGFLDSLQYFPQGTSRKDLVRDFLPVFRADLEVVSDYRFTPEPRFPWPIHVFGGSTDTFVAPEALEQWGDHTDAGHSLSLLPGGHFSLFDHGGRIFETVRTALSSSSRTSPQEVERFA
ncbi:alpha/beta fold hydrolase [Actinocorallia sp. B10E7]|uniref:thioesterase II family protein n=1 Tax=Actinocorallia sp. B10E7 TaxID=3153558 RepID=UPI00325C681B